MADPRDSNRGGPARLEDLLHVLRHHGLRPGDLIPIQAWNRLELTVLGVIDPGHRRAYRRALMDLDVIEQVGGVGRGHKIEGFRIRSLPDGPLLPLA